MKNELLGFYAGITLFTGSLLLILEILSRNSILIHKLTCWLKPWLRYRTVSASPREAAPQESLKLIIYSKRVYQQINRIKTYFTALMVVCMVSMASILLHIHWVR